MKLSKLHQDSISPRHEAVKFTLCYTAQSVSKTQPRKKPGSVPALLFRSGCEAVVPKRLPVFRQFSPCTVIGCT